VGDDVEFTVGRPASVVAETVRLSAGPDQTGEWELRVTNAQPAPVPFEAFLIDSGWKVVSDAEIDRSDGLPVWRVTVPANGRATLRYRIERP
jgi:hypothetical protein